MNGPKSEEGVVGGATSQADGSAGRFATRPRSLVLGRSLHLRRAADVLGDMLKLVAVSWRFMRPGELIADKYAVVQPIGSGGMGIVYEAIHTRLDQRVALKMLLPDLVDSSDAVARFEREARAAVHLTSPHVARVFDVDALPDGTPYIVMEFLEGRDLAEEIYQRGPLPVREAVAYLLQACDAMAEAHALGIVHRDLKPGNLFLADGGRKPTLKVLDFGISKIVDQAVPDVTTTRSRLGTAAYMSPEQVRSAKHVDVRTDVWSLGVVLYELLTGCQPFAGDTATALAASIVADPPHPLGALRKDVPLALERVVMTALEKDRDRRFADASALAAALAPFAQVDLRLVGERGSAGGPVSPTLPSADAKPASRVVAAAVDAPRPVRATPPAKLGARSRPRDRRRAWALALGSTSALALLSFAIVREMQPPAPATASATGAVLASSSVGPPAPLDTVTHDLPVMEQASPTPAAPPAVVAPAPAAMAHGSGPTKATRTGSLNGRAAANVPRKDATSTPVPAATNPSPAATNPPVPAPTTVPVRKRTIDLPDNPG